MQPPEDLDTTRKVFVRRYPSKEIRNNDQYGRSGEEIGIVYTVQELKDIVKRNRGRVLGYFNRHYRPFYPEMDPGIGSYDKAREYLEKAAKTEED